LDCFVQDRIREGHRSKHDACGFLEAYSRE
jgi:hypothetical protein